MPHKKMITLALKEILERKLWKKVLEIMLNRQDGHEALPPDTQFQFNEEEADYLGVKDRSADE
jgi:hypothetical protein